MACEEEEDANGRLESTPTRVLASAPGSRPEAFGPVEWGLLAGISVMWGSSFLFIALGVDSFAPGIVAFARLALGTVTLALMPRARAGVAREDRGRIAILGVLWMAIPFLLLPTAEQRISSALAGMINGAAPLFSALFASLLLRKIPGLRQIAGLVLGFGGVVTVVSPALGDSGATALGVALVLVAVLLYALAFNLAVPLQHRYGSLPVLLRAQVVALVAVTPVAVAGLPSSDWSWPSAAAMLPLGVLGTGVALVAMTTLTGRAGAARGSIAIYFLPVVAAILGVVFRDESIAPASIVGTALVLAGAWLTSRKET